MERYPLLCSHSLVLWVTLKALVLVPRGGEQWSTMGKDLDGNTELCHGDMFLIGEMWHFSL